MPQLSSFRPNKKNALPLAKRVFFYEDPIILSFTPQLNLSFVSQVRKKNGPAVFRNKMRRWFREEFFNQIKSNLDQGYYFFSIKNQVVKDSKLEIKQKIQKLFFECRKKQSPKNG